MQKSEKDQFDRKSQQKPLRIWPAILIVLFQWTGRFVTPLIAPESLMIIMFSVMIGFLAVIVWWAFFSRAPRKERFILLGLFFLTLITVRPLLHESMRLQPYVAYILPVFSLALVIYAVASRNFTVKNRRITFAAIILSVSGVLLLFRAEGVRGDASVDFVWRWQKSVEENLVTRAQTEFVALPTEWSEDITSEWPGFRGKKRDGIISGSRLNTDWKKFPPKELWRRDVGPGWSSFAVQGPLFFTQEQLGEDEVVSCYLMKTGEIVWQHKDKTRFWEANAGAGPRGTPTIANGRLYSLGATGILNVLDIHNGKVIWSKNAAKDTETKLPTWGFSCSPIIYNDYVFVSVSGSIIAYDINSGEPHWFKSIGGDCYSSPHLLTIDGVDQVLLLNDAGAISMKPDDGSLLWDYKWEGHPIVQPAITNKGDLLISVDERTGLRCLSTALKDDKWIVEERWLSKRIKPYFNDTVIYNDYAFGFYGNSLSCIDLKDGERMWKGGHYGRGQVVLLADQELLLVLSEKGDVALVNAHPDQHKELARFKALEGKTWNHPVLVKDMLLIRNSQEMAAYRLKTL